MIVQSLVIFMWAVNKPFDWPKQQQVEIAAWVLGVFLTVAAYDHKGRDKTLAHSSAVMAAISLMCWLLLPPL